MSKHYMVEITRQAERQMQGIVRYIADELKAPDAAKDLLACLEEAMIKLKNFPERVALTNEEPWKSEGVRRLPVKNYLIYFWIDQENLRVQVVAVVYAKRNQTEQLAQIIFNEK